MRPSTIAAALLAAGTMLATPSVASATTTAAPAHHAAAHGPCTPALLSSFRPRLHIACARPTQVSVDSTYDSYSKSPDPQPVHEANTFTHAVRPGEPWTFGEAVPAFVYEHHACVTVRVAGRRSARSCFDRPRLGSDGEPPAIEASDLTAMPAGWNIAVNTPGARVRVIGDYVYRTARGRLRIKPFTKVKALATGRTGQWTDAVAVPDGAAVLSADLTAVAVAPDGTTTWIGTTTYRAGRR